MAGGRHPDVASSTWRPPLPSALTPADAYFECNARNRPPTSHDGILPFLPGSTGRLLDAGCGSGHFTLTLIGRARHVTGLDRSPGLLAISRELQGKRGATNVAWVLGTIEEPPFRPASFDFVTSAFVLRLTDLPRALASMAAVLRPGGALAVQDILVRRPRLRYLPRTYVLKTLGRAPQLLRAFGPRMATRVMASRLSPRALLRLARDRPMSGDEVEATYRRILPGCAVTMRPQDYVAFWQKPGER